MWRFKDKVQHCGDMNERKLELFMLVLMRKWNAVRKIKHMQKLYTPDFDCYIRFDFYKKGDWEDSCDCWYIHEYFEYCSGDRIDKELLNRTVDNIKQTHCPHTIGKPDDCIASTGVHLIHAACAVNNIDVVQYMLQDDILLFCVTTTCARFPPAVVAVLKDSSDVIKSVAGPLLTEFGRRRTAKRMRWVIRDADTNALTEVTVNASYQHPLVCCFFLNVVYSMKTIKRIVQCVNKSDLQNILRYIVHKANRKTAAEVLTNFSQYVSWYDPDLAFQCVLWNKPETLSIVLRKSGNEIMDVNSQRYFGFTLQGIAEFLHHADCVRVLEAFKQCITTKQVVSNTSVGFNWLEFTLPGYLRKARGSPYTCLIFMYNACSMCYGCECLCQLLLKISENNYDVNEPGDNGLTVVHIVLLSDILKIMHCLENVFKTLCKLGADVNIEDDKGRNALDIAMTESQKYGTSLERLKVFKLVLSNNPSFNSNAITNAVERDLNNSLLQFVDDETDKVFLVGDDQSGVHAETTRDKYLALSFVAILLELGSAVKRCEIVLFDKLPDALRRYLIETISNPLSLKSMCRNKIRKTFPGPKLRRLLNGITIPKVIIDIILFRPYLHKTKITDLNTIEQRCESLLVIM